MLSWTAIPVSYKKSRYGPHASKISPLYVKLLLGNDCIERCEEGGEGGGYCSFDHQEYIDTIENFVWIMCVSYETLNTIRKPFWIPIPHLNNVLLLSTHAHNSYGYKPWCSTGIQWRTCLHSWKGEACIILSWRLEYMFKVIPFRPTHKSVFHWATMDHKRWMGQTVYH